MPGSVVVQGQRQLDRSGKDQPEGQAEYPPTIIIITEIPPAPAGIWRIRVKEALRPCPEARVGRPNNKQLLPSTPKFLRANVSASP